MVWLNSQFFFFILFLTVNVNDVKFKRLPSEFKCMCAVRHLQSRFGSLLAFFKMFVSLVINEVKVSLVTFINFKQNKNWEIIQ